MKYQIAIIGGGPAGYTAAEAAGKAGLSVVLFEKRSLGGVSTIVYTIALAVAPLGLALNSQFFRPTVNGLIAFSLRLLDKLQ